VLLLGRRLVDLHPQRGQLQPPDFTVDSFRDLVHGGGKLAADAGRLSARLLNCLLGPAELDDGLLGSLLDTAAWNQSRGMSALRLFEAGAVYLPREGQRLPDEPYYVAALLTGLVRSETWRDPDPRAADFFAAKGVLQGLLDKLGVPWSVAPGADPFLHPGRAARIAVRDVEIGWIGEIHPAVAEEWGLDETVAAFELDLDALGEPTTAIYEDVTSFPAVREDLAVVVPEGVASRAVVEVVLAAGAPLLEQAQVFDVYRNPERIGPGKVSLAIRLTYRARDRKLTDAEVVERRQAIVAAVEQQLNWRIRASRHVSQGVRGWCRLPSTRPYRQFVISSSVVLGRRVARVLRWW